MSDLNYLLETNDAMEWATAFCKQFSGLTITENIQDYPDEVNAGTMVAWFANAMAAQEYGKRG